MRIDWHKLLNSFYHFRLIATEALADFLASTIVKIYLSTAFLLDIGLWVFAYQFNNLAGKNLLILHYNVDFGINLIGQPVQIFTLPIFGLVVILINSWIVMVMGRKSNFFIHLLLASAIATILLLGVAMFMLYYINFL